jgi:hypothetical protein
MDDIFTAEDGEALADALRQLNDAAADAIQRRDEFVSAWREGDYDWLADQGFIQRRPTR